MKVIQIDSLKNDRLKWVVKLQNKSKFRYQENVYVVEGSRIISEASSDVIILVLIDRDKEVQLGNIELLKKKGYKGQVLSLPHNIFQSVSSETTPQGIMAVIKMPSLDRLAYDPKALYLALDQLQDPGNLGTLLRVADAVGLAGVILGKGCVDPFNVKVVKSAMGAIFRVPIYISEDLTKSIHEMQSQGIKVYGAYLDDSSYHFEKAYLHGTCFVIGNEGNGIQESVIEICDYRVKIPMIGGAESLNAAVAGSVLLYEALRQRMEKGRL